MHWMLARFLILLHGQPISSVSDVFRIEPRTVPVIARVADFARLALSDGIDVSVITT